MKKSEVMLGLLRIPMDALAVMAALLLSYRLREANIDLIPRVQLLEPSLTLPSLNIYLHTFVWPSILAFIVLAAILRLYVLRNTLSAWSEAGRIVVLSLLWLVTVMAWYFLVEKELFYSRLLLLHATFFLILFISLGRSAIILMQRALLRCGIGVRLVVSVGAKEMVEATRRTLEGDLRYRYLGHLPALENIQRLEQKSHLDLVLQTDPNPTGVETVRLIDYCRSHHIGYAFLPPVLADVPHQLRVERLGLLPLIRFQPTPLDGWGHVCKRLLDIVISLALIIILSPLLLLIALLIILDSGLPIFYVSRRTGEQGLKRIAVIKFRSMVKNADAQKEQLAALNHRQDGPLFKIKKDPRITRFGKVLRRWSLDELPQLFNVLAGQMSLVGPRPHLPEEVKRYSQEQMRVFAVRPGLTGYAQVSGRSDLTFEEEAHLDLQYIEEWSPLLDLWILWRTVFVVLKREGAD
jgi:exopolysaccharide biosynthesis polyprenyl glycosylphosphotransferase